jgi:hypothetical protein
VVLLYLPKETPFLTDPQGQKDECTMKILNEVRHALKVMTKKEKAMVLGINFLGGCLGPWGSAISITWTIGYVAQKSKEIDYTDPQLIKLVMEAQALINKKEKK